MHIEKNVFKQIIDTVMNVMAKTKDDFGARKDMSTQCKCKRHDVRVVKDGEGSLHKAIPLAPYILRSKERWFVIGYILLSSHMVMSQI